MIDLPAALLYLKIARKGYNNNIQRYARCCCGHIAKSKASNALNKRVPARTSMDQDPILQLVDGTIVPPLLEKWER